MMMQPTHPDLYQQPWAYRHSPTMPKPKVALFTPDTLKETSTVDTQAVLGKHGAPFQIDWEGKLYTLRFRTQKLKAEIERWVKQRAVKQLVGLKQVLPTEDYQERMDKLLALMDDPGNPDDVDKEGQHQGGYAFEGRRVQKLLLTEEGALALFRVVLGEEGAKLDEMELTCFFTEKQDEISAFFRASQSSVEALKAELEDGSDPKALMRALKKAEMW